MSEVPLQLTFRAFTTLRSWVVQGYLAHKKQPPPRTLQRVLGWSQGGVQFLMSEVTL